MALRVRPIIYIDRLEVRQSAKEIGACLARTAATGIFAEILAGVNISAAYSLGSAILNGTFKLSHQR